jgi:hypothetical protein
MLRNNSGTDGPRSRGDQVPGEAPPATTPKPFLSCQDGCGLPARWVLIRLAREPRRHEVPASEALCDDCLAKRVPADRAVAAQPGSGGLGTKPPIGDAH